MTKSLFLSKTFWANILGLALTVGGYLPAHYAGPILAIANIGLRLMTTSAVTVLPEPKPPVP